MSVTPTCVDPSGETWKVPATESSRERSPGRDRVKAWGEWHRLLCASNPISFPDHTRNMISENLPRRGRYTVVKR